MNILVVDDESQYRMLVGGFLQDKGNTVFLAEHGVAAMKIMEDTKMDFIISDVYMPVMDGRTTASCARHDL
ncbi:MAG: response regulator [Ignavibacteria bacterium]|nr:response regulator [Ignavibacteria bacterium]